MDTFAYAAGLFDGEGTVTLTRHRPNESRSPTASMTSTTRELVEVMRQEFGGAISHHTTKKAEHSEAWSWKVVSNRAIDFLKSIYPFMREPEKKRRAKMILTRYKQVTKGNGKYTAEEKEGKLRFEEEFFKNSRKFRA